MNDDVQTSLLKIGQAATRAAQELAFATRESKDECLRAIATAIRDQTPQILQANAADLRRASVRELKPAFVDRLTLTPVGIEAMLASLITIAELPDPVGRPLAAWTRPNGMKITRVAVPIGVIGIIYESRPNVAVDAGALCLKSGNACILRGGSDAFETSLSIAAALRSGIAAANQNPDFVQMIPTLDREAVGAMLSGLNGTIDLIVPRGGKPLVARVQAEACVPVLSHLDGLCHVYVHRAANIPMAVEVVLNAKMRRTGICGATETLLVDRDIAARALPSIIDNLLSAGCELRGDAATQKLSDRVLPATDEDWSTEYLDAIIAIKVVDGLDQAIDHIEHYGSHHTDAIVTDDNEAAATFLRRINSAIVLHNASTQFADGGEFGFGAEIGIATGKLHARGPVGLEQLTTYKYVVQGSGQTRPV